MKKAADTIVSCLKEKGLSQRKLAESMGEDVRHLNQQLVRQQDMKVERFVDVLDSIGYRVEVVDNDGIRKIDKQYANKVVETMQPIGKFWFQEADGYFIGIDNSNGEAFTEEFSDKEECFKWLRGEEAIDAEGIVHEV